ncbi:hypothetical protein CVS40_5171 [Lucilia cuprina]|nr:hypothetical protein CVS40_5171 [Lucilia cuprina]
MSKNLLFDKLSASLFSRHDLILLSYDFKITSEEQKITCRDFNNNIDLRQLEGDVVNTPWDLIFYMPTVDE